MRGDRAGEDGYVVSSLEHADDPAPGVNFRDRHDLSGEDLEILDFQAQIAHRVFGMRVETRADQDELRPKAVGQLFETRSKCGVVLARCRAMRQGDVQGVAQAPPGACLVASTRSGLKRGP